MQSIAANCVAADPMTSALWPKKSDICAVIVTFHPDDAISERIASIRHQVHEVLIVDNNSDRVAFNLLQRLSLEPSMHLIRNEENVGIASALNQGVRWAIQRGYPCALLLDQDTVPASCMVDSLIEAYEAFPRKDRLALIGSNYEDPHSHTNLPQFHPQDDRVWEERKTVITSGTLLFLAAHERIGPFRDEFFIDCVDLEYCLRARSKGFKVIVTSKPLMIHVIGQPTQHRLPWREIGLSNHNHIRRYYMIRNHIDLVKKYALREPAWVLASLWRRFKSIIVLSLFEEDRLAKVRYSAMGL